MLVSQHNPAFQDVAEALTNSLDRNGTGGMRAALNMGGNRITNAAAGTSPSDLATVAQASAGSIPIGVVVDYAGSTAPTGYLMCYGQAVSRTTYADLFAAIGTVYGIGDGATTFNLPDVRGRTTAGKDDMGGTAAALLTSPVSGTTLGAVGGTQSQVLTVPQLPSHTHAVTDPAHLHNVPGGVVPGGGIGGGGSFGQTTVQTTLSFTGITIQNTGSGAGHDNVQPTIIFNKIIRAVYL